VCLTNVDHVDLNRQRTALSRVCARRSPKRKSPGAISQSTMKCLRFLGKQTVDLGNELHMRRCELIHTPRAEIATSGWARPLQPKIAGDTVGIHFTRSLECRGYRQRFRDHRCGGNSSVPPRGGKLSSIRRPWCRGRPKSQVLSYGGPLVEHGEGCERI
jgi:hypothetical protein